MLRRLRGLCGRCNNLEKNLVLLNHPQLVAGALLERVESLFQVANFRVERAIALPQPRIGFLLLLQLPIEAPDPEPAALPEPKRILQKHYERREGIGEYFHLS